MGYTYQNIHTPNNWNYSWNQMTPSQNFFTPNYGTSSTTSTENLTWEEYRRSRESAAKEQAERSNSTQNRLSLIFKGLTKKEEKLITDYHEKKLEFHENLGQSLAFGAGLGVVLPNIKEFTHPFSAAKSAFSKKSWANTLFKDVVTKDAWKKYPGEMQQAFAEVHKAEIRYNKWKTQGILKRGYTEDEFLKLMDRMDDALKSGNRNKILRATEELRQVNSGIKQGWLPRAWNSLKKSIGVTPKPQKTIDDLINNSDAIKSGVKGLKTTTNMSFKGALKNSAGGKLGIGFAALSLLAEAKFIKAGFEQDSKTGWKQLGQSVAKAVSSWGGYIIGDALGKWGGAKLGAVIGSAVCPGLGTAIGAVAGIVLGTVCSWGLRKLTNWAVGDNVANKHIAKNDIKNAGKDSTQAQLIQNLVAEAQKDKNIDDETAAALAKAQQLYLTA